MNLIRPELFDFHGVSMTHVFTDNWEKIQNFQARPDDILIATYPKTGTTWVSLILDLLHFGQMSPERQTSIPIYQRVPFLETTISSRISGNMWVSLILDLLFFGKTAPERQTSIPIYERAPFLELTDPSVGSGVDLAENLTTSPRLIKTHFPIQFVPKSFWEQNCKIVYVARNAKDNMVSYFHFDRMALTQPEPGDWNTFLNKFMEGKVVYGSWHDHVNGWWKKKQTHSKLHYMFYEDMVEDTGREIDKLCSFLGLSPSVEEKTQIMYGVQFDNMKKNDMANYSTAPDMDFKISPFMRKGKVGDWKNHFTVAQNEEFEEDYKKKMKDHTLQFRTDV